MHRHSILNSAQDFVTGYFEKNSKPNLIFHHIGHTGEVVVAVSEISANCSLSTEESEAVIIAAWFHDLGYCHSYQGHELYSELIAAEFLQDQKIGGFQIEMVLGCIRATRIPQQPLNLIQMILCDADFYHFSRKDYTAHEQALRTEWELNLDLHYSDKQWNAINYELLKNHHYFTDYGQDILQVRKEVNIGLLLHKILT